MKPIYDIKFLNNKDFDNMPILDRLGEDVTDSWGVYNPHTGQIRVRDTGFWEVNKYLLDHELEHAVEEHATDQGPNGLRHKKGKKFFKQILLPLVTGYNAESGNWSPLGAIGNTGGKPKEGESQDQGFMGSFGGLNFGLPGGDSSTPMFGSSFNPSSGQQSQQSGLNQPLNQQSINPLSDTSNPYAKYGQQSGRLTF